MPRSKEQVEADDALTEAINQVREAYQTEDGPPYLLTDYVVVFAAQRFDDDGESWTMIGNIYRDQDVPGYRIIGLMEFALARMKHMINEEDD